MLSSNLSQASLKRPCSNSSRPSSKAASACSLLLAEGACARPEPEANRHTASASAAPARAGQRREDDAEEESVLSMCEPRAPELSEALIRGGRLGIPRRGTTCGEENAAYIGVGGMKP